MIESKAEIDGLGSKMIGRMRFIKRNTKTHLDCQLGEPRSFTSFQSVGINTPSSPQIQAVEFRVSLELVLGVV